MLYIMMHRTDAYCEQGGLPSEQLMHDMGALMTDMVAAGVFRAGEGLGPSAKGVRLVFKDGRCTRTPGPLKGGNELPAGFCIASARTLEEAERWARHFAEVVGDCEIDVRPVNEPWDIGMMEKPAGLETTRYMLMNKADQHSEAGAPMPPQMVSGLMDLLDNMQQAGALLASIGIQPSKYGDRLRYAGGKMTATDGPFAESKELIGGFCIAEVPDRAALQPWIDRFAAAIGDIEIDVRPLQPGAILPGAAPFGPACSPSAAAD